MTAAGLGLVMAQDDAARQPRASAAVGGGPAPAAAGEREADAEAIRAVADAFTKAYNAKDAEALGALFTEGAEIEDEDGAVTRGREAIVERFEGLFAEDQGGTLAVAVEAIHFLSPGSAVEQGTATITPGDGAAPETTRYSVVYVQHEGHWLHARIRDEAAAEAGPHEHLAELEWMLGEWINESDDALVLTTCRWSDDGHFLLRDFDVKIEGRVALRGIQRIGWDPLHKQFRTWVFDDEGGFAGGLMARDGDQWVVKASGVRADGQPVSATNIITVLGPDRIGWQTADRTVGGVAVPDIDQFVLVRKPPPPVQ
jgi:uncharacterized protein (TIGR02246 family)